MARNEWLQDIADTFEEAMVPLGTNTTTAAYKAFKAGYDYATAQMEIEPNPEPPEPETEGEQAIHCDVIVASTSVNTHINWRSSGNIWTDPRWKDKWRELGARVTRSAMNTNKDALAWWREIGANLIMVNGADDYDQATTKKNLDAVATTPDLVVAIEGPNEPNHENPPNWVTDVKTFQQWLFNTVNAMPALADKPVLGPSIWGRETAAYNQLGNIGGMMDFGNLHYYTGGRPPPVAGAPSSYDEGGDPDNVYTLADAVREAQIISPGKTIWITETGWPMNGPGCENNAGFVTPKAMAKYTLRMLCDAFVNKVGATSIYTLLDDVHRDPPRYHGLVDGQFQPRPAFHALKRFLAVFNDPNQIELGSLEFTAAEPAGVKRLPLMQKSDGSFLLCFWQDMAESYNRSTFKDVTPPPITVTLDFGGPVQVRVYRPTFETNWTDWGSKSSVEIKVPDEVQLVEITP